MLVPAAPALSSLVPSIHTAPQALAVAAASGALAAGSTAAFTQLFRRVPDLKGSAAFTAHRLVSLGYMVAASLIGVVGWYLVPAPLTPAARLLESSGSARFLGAMLLGNLVLSDLPLAAMVRELRKPDMVIHHIAMAIVCLSAATYTPFHYCLFYLGVAELSSIPLQLSEHVSHHAATVGRPAPAASRGASAL